jgi:carbamoyl-phosphate synthase small subunit
MNAVLALEDGTWFRGMAAGATGSSSGEVVFNTSMTGYQEVLTDPSYAGQIVTMTAPEIGNYGIVDGDAESKGPRVAGFVVREASLTASNWRASGTLRDYLVRHNIVAISDIDTRALTRAIRSTGAMRGVIATGQVDPTELVRQAKTARTMEGTDLVREVTCEKSYKWQASTDPGDADHRAFGVLPQRGDDRPFLVAAYDFGIKWNILRRLAAYGCEVHVFPATARPTELLAIKPDGVFLSNGPGDPAAVPYAIEHVRQLIDAELPMFGICLGHQVLGLALGAKTFKLKFGHRGANHPVKDLASGVVEITAQNHGFAVDPQSLPSDVRVTHLNLYDGTVEGFRHTERSIFAVQYHPEASPGPHDADYLFQEFVKAMEQR